MTKRQKELVERKSPFLVFGERGERRAVRQAVNREGRGRLTGQLEREQTRALFHVEASLVNLVEPFDLARAFPLYDLAGTESDSELPFGLLEAREDVDDRLALLHVVEGFELQTH